MFTVTLTKWGNSVGLRIPNTVLKEAKLTVGQQLKVEVNKEGVIMLMPVKSLREGWLEAFNAIADSSHDASLDESSNKFDEDEWQW